MPVIERTISLELFGDRLDTDMVAGTVFLTTANRLFEANRAEIEKNVPPGWWMLIDPVKGRLIANPDHLEAYQEAQRMYPATAFVDLGPLKKSPFHHVAAS